MCLWLSLRITLIIHNRKYSKLPRWSDSILNMTIYPKLVYRKKNKGHQTGYF